MPRASFSHGPRRPQKFYKAPSQPIPDAPPAITGTGAIAFLVPALGASGFETFSGTGTETFKVAAFTATGVEKFTGTATETFAHPALAATGLEGFTGTGAIAFGVPGLSGGEPPPAVIPEVGGARYRRPVVQPAQPQPLARLPTPKWQPAVVLAVAVDNTDAIVALYVQGAIDVEEFAALLAA